MTRLASASPNPRLNAAGCYTFVESLFLGGASTPFVRTTPGLVTETVIAVQALLVQVLPSGVAFDPTVLSASETVAQS